MNTRDNQNRLARPTLAFALTMALLGGCSNIPLSGPNGGQPQTAGSAAPPSPSLDSRQAVMLSAEERAQVLKEMNQFLGAVHNIQAALANKDFAAAARAAQAMGPRGGQHDATGQRLHEKLPQGWFDMARPTHQKFLAVARAAQNATTLEAVMQPLADTTRQCVACHAVYRLELQR